MKELTNINEQTFFATNVSEYTGFKEEGKHAILASDVSVLKLIESGANFSAVGLNQIIVIGDQISDVISKLIGVDVFVVGAQSWAQGIDLAAQSAELNNRIICIEDNETQDLRQLIESTLK